MEIWLVYLVKILLLPLSSLLILSFCGYFLLLKYNHGWILLFLSLFFLYLLSIPFVAVRMGKSMEKYPVLDFSILNKFKPQAIIVIGGGRYKFAPEYGTKGTVNSRTLLRLRYTAKLAKKIKLPVMVSGGAVFNQKLEPEARLMAAVLREEFNIAVQWLETQSRNTAENAKYAYGRLSQEEISRIILITYASHMPRAVKQFERVGFKVIPAPTVFLPNLDVNIFSFLPSANALNISSMAIHEWLGEKWYGIRYKDERKKEKLE
jgi:uncharacterized SAM-binding protein YcdF (DUF218 family)